MRERDRGEAVARRKFRAKRCVPRSTVRYLGESSRSPHACHVAACRPRKVFAASSKSLPTGRYCASWCLPRWPCERDERVSARVGAHTHTRVGQDAGAHRRVLYRAARDVRSRLAMCLCACARSRLTAKPRGRLSGRGRTKCVGGHCGSPGCQRRHGGVRVDGMARGHGTFRLC